jgi:hypothetical protein
VGPSGWSWCRGTPIPAPQASSVTHATPLTPTFPQVTDPSADLSGALAPGRIRSAQSNYCTPVCNGVGCTSVGIAQPCATSTARESNLRRKSQ